MISWNKKSWNREAGTYERYFTEKASENLNLVEKLRLSQEDHANTSGISSISHPTITDA